MDLKECVTADELDVRLGSVDDPGDTRVKQMKSMKSTIGSKKSEGFKRSNVANITKEEKIQ